MQTLPAFAAILVAALGSVACSSPHDAGERTGASESAIVDGTASDAADDAVVFIGYHDPTGRLTYACSGTLIAPNLVLTARHCVSLVPEKPIECSTDGTTLLNGNVVGERAPESLRIYIGPDAIATAMTERGAQTPKEAAHGLQIIKDDATTLCNHDIALIVLNYDVVGTYAPLHYDNPAPLDVAEAVGFGLTESGILPDHRVKRDVVVKNIGPYQETKYVAVGDGEMYVTGGACNGDSGGPLFNANHAVMGVASLAGGGDDADAGAAADCVGTSAWASYSTVGSRRALIESAFAAAGKAPWIEGQPNPFTVAAPAAADPAPAATTDAAPATTTEVTKSGCSTSPGSASSGASALLLAVGLAIAARRRQR